MSDIPELPITPAASSLRLNPLVLVSLSTNKVEAMFQSLSGLKQSVPAEISRLTKLPRPIKLTVLSVSLGLALMGALAMFFRRRRNRTQMIQKKLEAKNKNQPRSQHGNRNPHRIHLHRHQGSVSSTGNRSTSSSHKRHKSPHSQVQTPNGGMPPVSKKITSSSVDGQPQQLGNGDVNDLLKLKELSLSLNSLGADSNNSSSSTITHSGLDTANMSSADLCQLGMEKLSLAVSFWEDAVMRLSYLDEQGDLLAIPDSDTANLQHRLENLLDLAYKMQDNYERLCERQVKDIALESALYVFQGAEHDMTLDEDTSDMESFVSATDLANLADLESSRDILHNVPLYEAGLLELKYGNVPCRSIRPEMVKCLSDVEFLAKLHGIRLAFQNIFQEEDNRTWFTKMGRKLIGDLLTKADKDVEEFFGCYDKMLAYIEVESNWTKIVEELKGRGVRVMSFYDIVLDFILMDAFDDLANPPSTVITVVQNRWLSNGFKETALATAVWSVLKAKRSLLKFNDGFIAHFYSISEHTSPLLAWGFLGPESELKQTCNFFKELVLGFIQDIFSFDKVRFTTVESLAEDILAIAKMKSKIAAEKLNSNASEILSPML